jgi:hypothetical protein
MPSRKAHFQALSCFTTTGFTTQEAEQVVNHRHRRNIAIALMILGNVGLVGLITGFMQSVSAGGLRELSGTAGIVLAIVIVLLIAGRHLPPMRAMRRRVREALMRIFDFEPDPSEQILSYADGFGIVRVEVRPESPAVGKELRESDFAAHEVMVLAIDRGERHHPIPGARARIAVGDRLICYARLASAADAVNGRAWRESQELEAGSNQTLAHPVSAVEPPEPAPAGEDNALGKGITIVREAFRAASERKDRR